MKHLRRPGLASPLALAARTVATHALAATFLLSQAAAATATRASSLRRSSLPLRGPAPGEVSVTKLGDGTIKGPYLLPVNLGGQVLYVVADTGSFAFIVSSTLCNVSRCPKRAYDYKSSASYEALNGSRDVQYLSGTVDLELARDELEFAGQTRLQKFWEIVEMEDVMRKLWKRAAFEGVLGLPWMETVPGKDSFNETTVTEAFKIEAFTVCLGRRTIRPHFKGIKTAPSYIYWGPPGAIRWPSSMTFADVVGHHHWAVELSHVSVRFRDENKFRPFACFGGEKCAALIDTGSRVNTVPSQNLAALIGQLGGAPPKSDCSNYDWLPDIHFQLGGINVTLPRGAYVKHFHFSLTSVNSTTDMCDFLFEAQDVDLHGTPMWVLGHPFLQEYVAEFDRTRRPPRIGFSPSPSSLSAGGVCPEQPDVAQAEVPGAARQEQAHGQNQVVRSLLSPAEVPEDHQPELVPALEAEGLDALGLFGLGPSPELRPAALSGAMLTG